MTDPIADYLTRLRNAIHANHRVVEVSSSKMKQSLTKILFEKGYILSYKFDAPGKDNPQGTIKIALKYHPVTKLSAIRDLTRVSKPGLRRYVHVDGLPRVINGLGIAVVSTSKGLMTDKEARTENVGGEVICYIS
jgi:small subunit ribosomal protein S8